YRDDARGGMWSAKGETLADIEGDHKMEIALVRNIITELESMQDVAVNMPKNLVGQLSKGVSATELSDALANYLPMTIEQKQKILETLDLNERLKLVFTSLKEEKEISDIDKELQDEVRKSAEKNQREYFLREKLKAIRTELGENETDGDSEETILEKLEKNPYPESVKTKVKSELKRYQAMPQASLEASLIKSYIDTLMDVPWYQKTADNDDLENVKNILDEDHYGLDKVKKRIVEYLAVKKMTGNLKAPILCFYGPPGVGKTSLGKSIARALGRKFIKASLGGISDEAEIRGHRRTYVGSMPGRIIAGMKRAGVVNPVFLLDEVDKLSSSYKGDPSSALLEVLDPEQNFAFNDNFLEESYDLSNVLFIATANYIDNVPAPLRDRLELIEVNSYTEIEKIEIATRHLVKKQLLANGLQEKHVTFTREGIASIIESYTREAGVRELERKIASICRQVVVDLLTQKDIDSVTITPKEVRKYLGIELFENTKKDKENQVGVVTGLAYTEYGGDILPIEVNHFPGKGRLVLTGNLGDVMKESASIALDYIQANAGRYQIDSKIFGTDDIHIHVPEGAVPKDGPSAGIAITTAIISCLTGRPVDNNVAMTGEVTLRGNALPIGGLREKSLAALRSGIKTIIVPQENEKTVHELPEQVRKSIKFVYMKTVDDAVAVALLEKQSD
ncbi:MAG: endopeptidase La, partial [Firmicutes bacterium]|nr:endopeptidase La [Bacillota bacterium]